VLRHGSRQLCSWLIFNVSQKQTMNMKFAALIVILSVVITGCTIVSGSAVVIGKTRPPIDPSRVQIYGRAPAQYEEIAIVSAKAGHDFRSEQGIMDSAIKS